MPVEQPVFSQEELASETWRPVPGWPYSGSTLGRTRRDTLRTSGKPGHILRYGLTKKGRYKVQLWREGRARWFNVAQVIALAFYGPPPEGYEVDHKDTNKLNDRSDNLEYVTHQENMSRAYRNGTCPKGDAHYSRTNPEKLARGDRHPRSKLTDAQRAQAPRLYAQGMSLKQIGRTLGVHWTTVQRIIKPRKRRAS